MEVGGRSPGVELGPQAVAVWHIGAGVTFADVPCLRRCAQREEVEGLLARRCIAMEERASLPPRRRDELVGGLGHRKVVECSIVWCSKLRGGSRQASSLRYCGEPLTRGAVTMGRSVPFCQDTFVHGNRVVLARECRIKRRALRAQRGARRDARRVSAS